MRSKLLIGFVAIFLVFICSGCIKTGTSNTDTTTKFDDNGIVFQYPSSWTVINTTEEEIARVGTRYTSSFSLKSGNETQINESTQVSKNFFVRKAVNKAGIKLEDAFTSYKKRVSQDRTVKNITDGTITVDGITSYTLTFTFSDKGSIGKQKDVMLEKNGTGYILSYVVYPPSEFNENEFNNIIQSFKIK